MEKPSGWQRWIRQPQLLRWRRFVVQLHLWIGLTVGIYIVVLSVSGSVSVIRPDVHRWFVPRSVAVEGTKLTGDALQDAVRRTYPEYEVTSVFERRRPDAPVMVTLQRDGATVERLFDPYAARDLGLTYPPITEAMEWVVDLHDNLLTGTTGRAVNGVGALLFLSLVITGRSSGGPVSAGWGTPCFRANQSSQRGLLAGSTTRLGFGCSRCSSYGR
jgi:uncharacterized iron-regulated membrane protein